MCLPTPSRVPQTLAIVNKSVNAQYRPSFSLRLFRGRFIVRLTHFRRTMMTTPETTHFCNVLR
jgi:hypothetical protein